MPVPETARPAVEVRGVHKHFRVGPPAPAWRRLFSRVDGRPLVEVLKGVDLTVHEGQTVAILGASGSGKSTLLRCINHLETIDDGRILVDGHLVGYTEKDGALVPQGARRTAQQRAGIGMVFQQFNLFPNKTALGNVMAPLRAIKRMGAEQARAIAVEQLTLVGLADRVDAYPSRLSGGQKQRVAIARALAMDPAVMLFDEPTSALDPELVTEVLAVIQKIALGGTTAIIVTHEVAFARDVADRVVVMDGGVIVEEGPTAQVFSSPQHPRTRGLLQRSQARGPAD